MKQAMKYIHRVFSLDLRSIALFRIILAAVILADLGLRSLDLSVFYSDEGILPRTQWLEISHIWHWSIHAASGELWWQIVLFVIAALFAVALLFGYRTRLAALGSFVLLVSLINRNELLLQGGDQLLVIMSFWSLFLPLGARYSMDAALQRVFETNPNAKPALPEQEQPYFSIATIAIVFQILYLYIFTAILKTGDAWVTRFDAAYYAVSLQHFATPVGVWIQQFPDLLKVATVYVLGVEFIAPFLVLCPFFWPWFRMTGLLLLGSLHMAFLLMLHIGLFPFIDFMALSLLIPGVLWVGWHKSRAQSQGHARRQKIRLYYDQDCGFCLKMCLLLRTFLLGDSNEILPAQQYPDIYSIMERENSWVITDPEGKPYIHWHAMAYLFSQRWPFKPIGWLMSIPPLLSAGNRTYRWVADNRALMGTLTSRFLPYRALRLQPTLAGSLIAGVAFYVATSFNIHGLPQVTTYMPRHVDYLARSTRLEQRWDMFAPFPLTLSSYVLIPGKLRNGESVDVYPLTSSKPGWQPPERFYPLYDGYRWRKYLGRVDGHNNNAVRSGLGSYLCRQWNAKAKSRDTQLATLEIVVVTLQTNTEDAPKLENRRRIWRHWCFPEYADPS